MNAVRSHYLPDKHFLEICDSLGIFYLNELAGWQNSYDTETGLKLLSEMINRDVNHPCIFMWSNGNEGGWNKNIDAHFADYDPQKRHVIHPWADFNGLILITIQLIKQVLTAWQTDIMYLCLPNFYMDFMIADKEPAWMIFGIAISLIPYLQEDFYGHTLMKPLKGPTKRASGLGWS